MNEKLSAITINELDKIVNKAISELHILKLNYGDWNNYYKLLLGILSLQVPTIRSYDLANALMGANVICQTPYEEKDLNTKVTDLAKSISQLEVLEQAKYKKYRYPLIEEPDTNDKILNINSIKKGI